MTTVSIALATHNGADFLRPQLDSYLVQTRRPDELVVGDDGSTDATIDLLERFAAHAPFPVRILRSPVILGFNRNFERVINACAGGLILPSDQDDIWFPDKIATVMEAMAARPDMLALHHDEWLFDSDSGERLAMTFNQRARRARGWDHNLFAGNCSVLRKELLPIAMPIPDGQDFDAWLSLIPERLGARLIVDTPLQLWRRHGTNSSQPALAEVDAPDAWKLAERFAETDPRPGWSNAISELRLLRERIDRRRGAIDALLGNDRADHSIAAIDGEITAIDRRSQRLEQPRKQRWRAVGRAWLAGDYDYFAGWRSAAKDAVRTP